MLNKLLLGRYSVRTTTAKKNTLSMKKEPIEDVTKLDLVMMFKILRKNEYEAIITDCYGEIPQVTQFKHYRVCFRNKFSFLETVLIVKKEIPPLLKNGRMKVSKPTTINERDVLL